MVLEIIVADVGPAEVVIGNLYGSSSTLTPTHIIRLHNATARISDRGYIAQQIVAHIGFVGTDRAIRWRARFQQNDPTHRVVMIIVTSASSRATDLLP